MPEPLFNDIFQVKIPHSMPFSY
uniref:Uncharacterized protein n=1 Tax=Anguilla anguilla TaxID=7936 RepID=A0A0E9UWP4_ANGAN